MSSATPAAQGCCGRIGCTMPSPIGNGRPFGMRPRDTQRRMRRAHWAYHKAQSDCTALGRSSDYGELRQNCCALTVIYSRCWRCGAPTWQTPATKCCTACGEIVWHSAALRPLWRQLLVDAQRCACHLYDPDAYTKRRGAARGGNALLEMAAGRIPPWFKWYAEGVDRADPEAADVVVAQGQQGQP